MRRWVSLRCMACMLFGLVLYLLLLMPCVQAETKTLTKDTELHPQGWAVGDLLEFKKGMTVHTNDLGEVISGTLAKNAFLQPRGWERVINDYHYVSAYLDTHTYFPGFYRFFVERSYNMAIPGYGHVLYKGGTAVIFSENGDVMSGTLAEQATIRLIEGKYGFVAFRKNTILTFYDSGVVMSGVLDEDTRLRPVGWAANDSLGDAAGFLKFSAKKAVEFNEKGEVISGTLKEAVKWRSTEGTESEFPAKATVRFSEQGAVVEKMAS